MKSKKTKTDHRVVITGIGALVVLESVALINGVNGQLLTIVLMIIAGLAGWAAPKMALK